MKPTEKTYTILTSLLVVALVTAQLTAGKLCALGGFPLPCGAMSMLIAHGVARVIMITYGSAEGLFLCIVTVVVSSMITLLVWIAHSLPIAISSPISARTFGEVFGYNTFVIGLYMTGSLYAHIGLLYHDAGFKDRTHRQRYRQLVARLVALGISGLLVRFGNHVIVETIGCYQLWLILFDFVGRPWVVMIAAALSKTLKH